MRGTNGKNSDTFRRSVYAESPDQPCGLGELRGNGQEDGDKQIGTSTQDGKRGVSGACSDRRSENSDIGKILERLDALEKRYLDYVNAHESRLRARLSDAEHNKDEFLRESSSIRDEILLMMTQEIETHTNNNDRPII